MSVTGEKRVVSPASDTFTYRGISYSVSKEMESARVWTVCPAHGAAGGISVATNRLGSFKQAVRSAHAAIDSWLAEHGTADGSKVPADDTPRSGEPPSRSQSLTPVLFPESIDAAGSVAPTNPKPATTDSGSQYRLYLLSREDKILAAENFHARHHLDARFIAAATYGACDDCFASYEIWYGTERIFKCGDASRSREVNLERLVAEQQARALELEERLEKSFACVRASKKLMAILDRNLGAGMRCADIERL